MTNPAPPVDDALVRFLLDQARHEPDAEAEERAYCDKMQRAASLLSRIPSEDATDQELRVAFAGYRQFKIGDANIAEILKRAGLRITRAPGAKT